MSERCLVADNLGLAVVRLGVPQGDSGEKLNRFATAECQLFFSTICRTRFMKLPITDYGNLIGSDNQCP
jgi:hypothetical protein